MKSTLLSDANMSLIISYKSHLSRQDTVTPLAQWDCNRYSAMSGNQTSAQVQVLDHYPKATAPDKTPVFSPIRKELVTCILPNIKLINLISKRFTYKRPGNGQ